MSSLLLYLILFIFCYIVLKIRFKHKKVCIRFGKIVFSEKILDAITIAISIAPIIYILWNRVDVGTDYRHYLTIYNDYTNWGYINDEIGLIGIMKLSDILGWGYKGFLLIASLLGLGISSYAIKQVVDDDCYPIAMIMYLSLYFGPLCNIIAQTIALSFVVLAYKYCINKRPILFLIFCLFGMLFHKSAIVILPIYIIYNNGKWVVRLIGVLSLLGAVLICIMPNSLYSLLNEVGLSNYLYVFDKKIPTFLYVLFYRTPLYIMEFIILYKNTDMNKSDDYCITFWKWMLLLEVASCILGISISWGGRLVYYFSIAHVIIDTDIINNHSTMNRRLLTAGIFFAYYLIAFILMHFYSGFDGIMAYHLL